MKQEIEKLRTENDRIIAIDKLMADALCELEKVASTRETAITRTKLEEARMWLEKRQAQVCTELARKTCR